MMDIKNDSVIDILKRALDEMIESGEIDDRDDYGLFKLGSDIMSWKNIKKNWPNDYSFLSKYVHDIPDDISDKLYSAESENVETFKLNDSTWEFIGFNDGYDGYRVTLTNEDGKLKLVNYEFANDDDCNQYGMNNIDNLLK